MGRASLNVNPLTAGHMRFALRVTIGLLSGLALGFFVVKSHSPLLKNLPALLDPVGVIFINAIRLTVIPIVVSSLIVAIASSGGVRAVGKLGTRAVALILAVLLAAALFGAALALPLLNRLTSDKPVNSPIEKAVSSPTSISQWFISLVPSNIPKAAADGAMLPLIVVSIAFGSALTQVEPERRKVVITFFQGIFDTFLILVRNIVKLAPVCIFALAVGLVTRVGGAAAGALASYMVLLPVIMAAFAIVVLYPAAVVFGKVPLSRFIKAAAPAQALAFASQSSLAALPAVYTSATELDLPEAVCDFFLPLAASVFRAGGATFQVVAVLFLARFYGVALGPTQLATAILMAVATSITIPGVPGGAVIVMAPLLSMMSLPPEGIGILLAVETIPDMVRTVVNVTGWFSVMTILGRQSAQMSK